MNWFSNVRAVLMDMNEYIIIYIVELHNCFCKYFWFISELLCEIAMLNMVIFASNPVITKYIDTNLDDYMNLKQF